MSGDEHARIGLVRSDLFRTAAFMEGDWVDGTDSIAVVNPAAGSTIANVTALGRDGAMAVVTAAEVALLANERAHRVAEALQYGMIGLNTKLICTEVEPETTA